MLPEVSGWIGVSGNMWWHPGVVWLQTRRADERAWHDIIFTAQTPQPIDLVQSTIQSSIKTMMVKIVWSNKRKSGA